MVEIASFRRKRILFHNYSTFPCGLGMKSLSKQTFSEENSVKEDQKQTKLRYGTVNFEKRKHPRFNVDLPIECSRTHLSVEHGHAINASEGGLLLYLPEQMEIGNHLKLKIFFMIGSELNAIETLVEVVWVHIHLGKDWGEYRTGVRFVQISTQDVGKLKHFLSSLSSS